MGVRALHRSVPLRETRVSTREAVTQYFVAGEKQLPSSSMQSRASPTRDPDIAIRLAHPFWSWQIMQMYMQEAERMQRMEGGKIW